MPMKKVFIVLTVLVALLVSFISCDMTNDLGNGSLVITFNDARGRSTEWLPEKDMEIASYTVSGTRPDGGGFSASVPVGDVFVRDGLEVGQWTIAVDGRNGYGELIAEADEFIVVIRNSQSTTRQVILHPVQGLGDFSLTVNWEDAEDRLLDPKIFVTIRNKEGDYVIQGPDELERFGGLRRATRNFWLDAGWYEVTVGLFEGVPGEDPIRLWQDVFVMRIVADEQTVGMVELQETQMNFGTGTLDLTVESEMSNPFEVSFYDLPDVVETGESIILFASGDYGDGAVFRWYVDGERQGDNSDLFIYDFQEKGVYSITLLVLYNGALARYGDTIEVVPSVPSQPPTGPLPEEYVDDLRGIVLDGQGEDILGKIHGAVFVIDRFGTAENALSFDGIDDFVEIITPDTDFDEFSISMWFNTSVAGGVLISSNDGDAGSGVGDKRIYLNNEGKLFAGVYGGPPRTVFTDFSVADGVWHHALLTQGDASFSFYVDGMLIGSFSAVTDHPDFIHWSLGYNYLIGDWPNTPTNKYFNGILSDVCVYDHAMTPEQIDTL